MTKSTDMIDIAFNLQGGYVPASYPFALWQEIVRCLPWLNETQSAGMLPLRGSVSGGGLLLPQRARLVLRLPAALAPQAELLSGQKLSVEFSVLSVGEARLLPLQPHPTLHAQLVASMEEEEVFLAGIAHQLSEMGISCKWICGKRHTIADAAHSISGYSLVLHDLKPDRSLQLQRTGLGEERRFGCGIFVPYKAITGLD